MADENKIIIIKKNPGILWPFRFALVRVYHC